MAMKAETLIAELMRRLVKAREMDEKRHKGYMRLLNETWKYRDFLSFKGIQRAEFDAFDPRKAKIWALPQKEASG